MYLVDTSIIVYDVIHSYLSLTQEEKNLHKFLKKIPPEQKYIPDFILTELSVVATKAIPTKYGIKNKKVIKEITCATSITIKELLQESNIIMPTYAELDYAADIFLDNSRKKIAQEISFPDFLLIAMAKERDLVLLTADKALIQFSKQQGALVNQEK
jgi:predicted nucleic acid-binding protein